MTEWNPNLSGSFENSHLHPRCMFQIGQALSGLNKTLYEYYKKTFRQHLEQTMPGRVEWLPYEMRKKVFSFIVLWTRRRRRRGWKESFRRFIWNLKSVVGFSRRNFQRHLRFLFNLEFCLFTWWRKKVFSHRNRTSLKKHSPMTKRCIQSFVKRKVFRLNGSGCRSRLGFDNLELEPDSKLAKNLSLCVSFDGNCINVGAIKTRSLE